MSTDTRTATFESPTPIDVSFALQAARLELVASDRTTTVVTVAPRNPSRAGDLNAVQQLAVEYTTGQLSIVAPKRWSIIGPGNDSIVVTIELPAGSTVGGEIAFGNVRGTGRLGDTRIKSSYGELAFDELGAADLKTSSGDIAIGASTGDFELTTSNGGIRADILDGSGSAKTSNGEIAIGEVTGALQARASYGGIRVDYAGPETFAKIAYGNLHIGEVVEGSVKLEGNGGDIKVGVPEGTAAWLDVNSAKGFVRNELTAGTAPQPGDKTVEIRARVTWGDIVIHRPVNRRPGERRAPQASTKTVKKEGNE
jgi:hypothetical protein